MTRSLCTWNGQAVYGWIGTQLAAMNDPQAIEQQAAAVFLGDMPWIKMDSLGYLLALASPEHIVVPTFQGHPGHPVIFGRRFWPELQQLTGESGAKALLREHAQRVRHLELDDPGILRDIDTPQCMGESPLIL